MTTASSSLELRFERLWKAVAPDLSFISQLKGVVPGRRYVYDFFIPEANVLIEVNGGIHARGRSGHSSGTGIARDADKVNQAQFNHKAIMVLTSEQLTKEYVTHVANYCRQRTNNKPANHS
jgi:hypothetical protein